MKTHGTGGPAANGGKGTAAWMGDDGEGAAKGAALRLRFAGLVRRVLCKRCCQRCGSACEVVLD